MIFLILALMLVIVFAWFAIPADVRELIDENCRSSSGRIRPKYLGRELAAVVHFYSGVLFFAALVAAFLIIGLVLTDSFLLPTDVIDQAASAADGNDNPDAFFASLRDGHERWFASAGGSQEAARNWQRILLIGLPCLTCVAFVAIAGALRLTSLSYNASLRELVHREVRRNRRRITARYLASTAQSQYRD